MGSDLRQQSRELVTLIIRANSRREKLPVLYDLREWLEELQVLLQIGKAWFVRFDDGFVANENGFNTVNLGHAWCVRGGQSHGDAY